MKFLSVLNKQLFKMLLSILFTVAIFKYIVYGLKTEKKLVEILTLFLQFAKLSLELRLHHCDNTYK